MRVLDRARCLVLSSALLAAVACSDALVGGAPGQTPGQLFDIVWRDFDRYYSFFEIKNVDWDVINQRYRSEAAQSTSPAGLATVIARMFDELHDPHVDLFTPPNTFYRSIDFTAINTYFNPITVFSRYVPGSVMTASRNMRYARVGSDVGYVWIASFGGTGWADEIDDVLASFGSARAVIIDLRNNGGGNTATAEAIAARFADGSHRFAYVRFRNGPRHGDFTDFIALTIAPAGPKRFAGPVIVLTNRLVVSASEHFVLAMRQRAGTTFLGDTTAGGFGNPLLRELPNGWAYRVPQWIEYGPSKEVYENIGLAPDRVVPHSAVDSLAVRDPQLEAAIALARGG